MQKGIEMEIRLHAPLFTDEESCIFVTIQNKNEIIGELIMQNEALGYTHVMKLSLDPSTLKGRKGVIKARLNSYVPMSNVKALFHESK